MTKKILLVEDERGVADIYQLSLTKHGFQVLLAENGSGAIQLAQKEQPDLILLDIILPDKDGFSVLKTLKKDKATQAIPVILLTNLGQVQDQKYGQELGAQDYLIKANYTPEQISQKVQAVLD
jgi:DNA-binding response OmpR family regulator